MAQKKRTGPKPRPDAERVLERATPSENGCLIAGGKLKPNGYGRAGRNGYAHRAVYEHFYGPIPPGLQVDHRCHNEDPDCPGGPTCPHRACVNHEHLQLATPSENISAGRTAVTTRAYYAAKTHCKNGHRYTPETESFVKNGSGTRRRCLICMRAYSHKHYHS
jgi:hypothetical protein